MSSAQADVMLRVRPHVVVSPDSEVHLSQLVDAQTMSASNRKRLDAVTISRAPAYGEKQELSNTALMAVLRDVVEAERISGQHVHVVLPKSVTIDTLKREINAAEVSLELTQAWQPLCADCQLVIEGLSLPRVADVRDWNLKVKPELPRGSFSVPVDLVRENGALLPAWISGRLVAKRKVPVARRLLNVGEHLSSADVTWEYRDTSYAYDGVPSEAELSGKIMRQGLRSGDIVFRGQLDKEKAVHRGETVQIRSHEGVWEVSLNAVAQQDAAVGDTVNLKNAKTGTGLTGEVVAPGEVELR
jgi:flagella basal body P-ring formation protein FlgA